MRIDLRGAVMLFAVTIMAACETAQTAARSDVAAVAATPAFNAGVHPTNGCWARLYEREDFQGPSWSISGPAQISNLPPYLGFSWEPRYESLTVGATATVGLFEDPNLRNRATRFGAGVSVRDLDDVMGLFRRIRSVEVTCAK